MAAEDGEIVRHVWNSYIPCMFRLSANEVTSLQEPDPYYSMVSRLSYFPLVIDKVIKHFTRFVHETKQSANDLWLDFDGIPLKWHYPIGLLWDLHGCADGSGELPFNITVHFQDFPEEELVRCNSRAAIEAIFLSSLKEADALKHRSQVMCSLQKKDHNQLWLGLLNDKFDQFWAINRKLMEVSEGQHFRYIPFRVYSHERHSLTQRLVKAIDSQSQQETTLAHLRSVVFGSESAHNYKLVLHGIEPPMETPLQWLSQHLSYPDNFLHIVAVRLNTHSSQQ